MINVDSKDILLINNNNSIENFYDFNSFLRFLKNNTKKDYICFIEDKDYFYIFSKKIYKYKYNDFNENDDNYQTYLLYHILKSKNKKSKFIFIDINKIK